MPLTSRERMFLSLVDPREIKSLGTENFEKLKPVHRFNFLFKWQPEEPVDPVVRDPKLAMTLFAKCITQDSPETQNQ